jgi:ferritin-like metal-binding protein YciE
MPMRTLQDAMVEEMQDLLHAENQIAQALPRMAERAANSQLKEAFQEHMKQTEGQIERLKKAFEAFGSEPKGKRCEGIAGILEEGEEFLGQEEIDPDVRDALLIASAQKVEHYEIASYGTLCTWADMLENRDVADLLTQNLNEEKEADEKLTRLATERVNKQAM